MKIVKLHTACDRVSWQRILARDYRFTDIHTHTNTHTHTHTHIAQIQQITLLRY